MRLAFQPGVALAATSTGVVLRRSGVPVDHSLPVAEALALAAIDGTGDSAESADFVSQCLGDDSGARWVGRVTSRYWPFLTELPGAASGAIDVAWLRDVDTSRWVAPSRRAAAPRLVNWLTTLGCNRRCPYCFYDVFHHAADAPAPPSDATMSTARAIGMVREMGAIGAANLYLTGGEPLLRPDLVEVIAEATVARVRTHVTTKLAIDGVRARALAAAGLTSLTFSLDDARPHEAAMLAGARGFLQEALASIAAVLDAGIPVRVNCVVTAVNEAALPALGERLIDLGVKHLTVGRFSPPSVLRLTRRSLHPQRSYDEVLAELQDRFAGRLTIESSSSGSPDAGCGADLVCEVGIAALDVLPDGSVTRCRYLPGRRELVVGSLRDQGLLEIWQGARLQSLVAPDRSDYADTSCSDCGGFDGCNRRGRCYFTAMALRQRLHAPDAFCVR